MPFKIVRNDITMVIGRDELRAALDAYIDANYVEEKQKREYVFGKRLMSTPRRKNSTTSFLRPAVSKDSVYDETPELCEMKTCAMPSMAAEPDSGADYDADYDTFWEENESALKERMKHMSDTFQEYLLYLIEEKGLTNAEVYKRAIITKQLFSKIKLNPNYHPDKATAMRLCVGARLNLDETKDLLARAGYALSPCDKRDIIFSFFIEKEVWDMIEIDIMLEEHGLPCFIE